MTRSISEQKKEIAQKIKLRRKQLGFKTQADLASALELAPSYVGKWESGVHEPTGKNLEALLDVLEWQYEDLFSGPSRERKTITDLAAIIDRQERDMIALEGEARTLKAKVQEIGGNAKDRELLKKAKTISKELWDAFELFDEADWDTVMGIARGKQRRLEKKNSDQTTG